MSDLANRLRLGDTRPTRATLNKAADRIEALETVLRVMIAEPDGCVSPSFKALAATALGPEQDK